MELQADKINKTYKGRKVVKDVSLTLKKGEIVGLLGPMERQNHFFLHDSGIN